VNIATYKKLTAKDLVGRKVKTNVELENRLQVIPAGTICTIDKKDGGFSLTSAACPHCGVKICIGKVPPQDVELLLNNRTGIQ
jgi:nitrite reductase/ring-hydroxylating ferredoxin subunit